MATYPSPFASTLGAAAANHAAMASYLKATSSTAASSYHSLNHHMNGLSALTAGMTSSASSSSSLMDSSHLYGGGSYSEYRRIKIVHWRSQPLTLEPPFQSRNRGEKEPPFRDSNWTFWRACSKRQDIQTYS